MKSGFNTCNMKKESYILPKIINSFIKLDSFSLANKMTQSLNQIYLNLLNLYKDNKLSRQRFISYDEEPIYTSPAFHDYNINISALAFLSFLIEYQMFLNCYTDFNPKNITYNTLKNPRNNNFQPIRWTDVNRSPRIYRDSIYKADMVTILNSLCSELDRLYSRFLVTLLSNLANILKVQYNDVKSLFYHKNLQLIQKVINHKKV